jgi:NAD(P)-dependent dehydrogenase (short-subunit alcohol dehydrogenase family)
MSNVCIAKCFSRVNSKTAFFVLKEAATHVSDGGKIISIVTALLGAFTGYYTSYAGSKAPVEHFTRYVASSVPAEVFD